MQKNIKKSKSMHHIKFLEKSGIVIFYTTVSSHEFDNSNSIFHTLNLHMGGINSPLSFFNSSIKTKWFVYDLYQKHDYTSKQKGETKRFENTIFNHQDEEKCSVYR